MAERKAFNFYRSYFDVFNELENDKDKLSFITALLERQFCGITPEKLKGMAKFAYMSQRFNIDSQVDGYESKTGNKLIDNKGCNTPCKGGCEGGSVQEKGKGKEKGKEEEKVYRKFAHLKLTISEYESILKDGYSKIQIDNILDAIENYKKNTGYVSLNLTARKWLKKEHPKTTPKSEIMDDGELHYTCKYRSDTNTYRHTEKEIEAFIAKWGTPIFQKQLCK